MNPKSTTYTKATEVDEPELRQILKENPMQGSMVLSFEREPYFFKATQIEGENHVTILGRDEEEQIVGMGSRSSRSYWFSGQLNQVGYLSQLRVNKNFRGVRDKMILGWQKMQEIHYEINDAPFYLVTVLEENHKAIKLLTSGIKDIPIHQEWGRLNTFILPLIHKKVDSSAYLVRRATQNDKQLLIHLIQENYRSKPVAPYWDEKTLFHPDSNLTPEDFFIAYTKEKPMRPLGCLAVWDQRTFKQVQVQDYEAKLKKMRPLLNLLRRWTRYPYFPQVGESFSHAYLSHLALENEHSKALIPLVQTAINTNIPKGFHYLSLGLLQNSIFSLLIEKELKPFTLKSILYWAYWPDEKPPTLPFTDEKAHLEIAIL